MLQDGKGSVSTQYNVKLDIIIVNWNSGVQLRQCLASIASADLIGFTLSRVCVVDNASKDNSLNEIRQFGLPLCIIRNNRNLGFAKACNQGAEGSQADYLLFLNPDVRLFKNSLKIPIAFMEQCKNEKIGICGIQLVDEKGRISRTCARFPKPYDFWVRILGLDKLFPAFFRSYFMKEWDHRTTRIVDHVIGAFYLVRRSIFEKLGGFDERFFVYFEDLDFSYRAYKSGWKSVYLSTVQAYHKGGGTSEQIKAKRLFYSLQSRILYGYKHFSIFSATFLMLGVIFVEFLMRLILATVRCSAREIGQTVHAYALLVHAFPFIIKNTKIRKER